MKALIKIGGTLLDSPESRTRLAAEIGQAVANGLQAAVIHGGGKQMTRFLAERGVESQFVNGLRVTTPDVLDAVLKVFAGTVNKELVAAFIANGTLAVGLCGIDALLTEASQLSEEMGAVGKPINSNIKLLTLLIDNGYLPVVACVAGDRQGRFYNVNADQMAASLAHSFKPDQVFFLTDVAGVMDSSSTIYDTITGSQTAALIANNIATGGMRAKLEAASAVLLNGFSEVIIAPGAVPGIIAKLIAGERIGTRLLREQEVSNHA